MSNSTLQVLTMAVCVLLCGIAFVVGACESYLRFRRESKQ